MGPSFSGESNLDQIIVSRIRAAVANLANAKEQIKKEGIKGDTDDSLKRFLVGVIEKVDEQIEPVVQEIQAIRRDDVKRERSDRVHRNLEGFLYDVDLIRTATLQIPIELYYFTRDALCHLRYEDIKVVFIPGASLGTTNLSDNLKTLFEFLDGIPSYIDSVSPFYWIILVPPSLIRTPLNWPLIAHEIGHILERQRWNLVSEYYQYPIVPSLSPADMKSCYAQEFQADFVALSYFGPIFAHRLLAIYDTGEFAISLTHPPRRERLDAIADKLQEMGFATEATVLKELSSREEPSLIVRSSVEHLNEILAETARMLNESSCVYTEDHVKERKAKSRIDRFTPYTDDMRTLLNVADGVRQSMLQSISDTTKKRDVESEFDYLLLDSIRLTYIKQTSQPAFS